MAHSLSAKKRVRQDAKKRITNRSRKSMIKTQIKRLETALGEGDIKKAEEQFQLVVKKLDKIASTSTMHKNTTARLKSRLSRRLNSLKSKKT